MIQNSAGAPEHVLRAARAWGFSEAQVGRVAGASGQTWTAGDHFLRVGPRERMRVELAALAAAGSVVPTARVLATTEFDDVAAALFQRLPGSPAGDLRGRSVAEARARGRECGRLHALLAGVRAPVAVPVARAAEAADVAAPDSDAAAAGRLVHLDLHPFNVLIDEAGRISAVLDWANAARGHPDLDRARTLTILTLDPAAVRRRVDRRWAALTEGWIEAGMLGDIPSRARAWACRYMLLDLRHRYADPQLRHVRAALRDAERGDEWLPDSP